jgi:integrase
VSDERLYKRGRVWWCWYYDKAGVCHRVSTKQRDKEAARLALRQFERTAADPRYAAENATTIDAALRRLVAHRKERERAEGTIKMYETKAGHIRRILGKDTPLAHVDARAVDRFVSTRLSEGAAHSTLGKELTTLRATLKVAKRRGEFTGDIDEVMPDAWSIKYKPRTRFLTAPEAQALIAELLPDRGAHVCFLLATGARWSESLRARAADINTTHGEVRMRGTKTEAAARTIPIVAFGWPLLERALEVRGGSGGPMFRPWTNVRHDLAAACARAGIAPVTPNDLRRTAATWLRQLGAEPSLIAPFLGHTDSRMVERVYGRMPVETLGSALRDRCETIVKREGQKTSRRAPVAKATEVAKPRNHKVSSVPRDGIEPPTRGFSIPYGRRRSGSEKPVSRKLLRVV